MESYKGSHLSPGAIESYLQGKLKKSEAHKLESHLNLCTLCAEAVEGYREFSDQTGRFGEKNSVNKNKSGRIKALTKQTLGWAASIILVIAAVVFVYNEKPEPLRESTVAMKNETEAEEPPAQNDQLMDESAADKSANYSSKAIPEPLAGLSPEDKLVEIQEDIEVESEISLDSDLQEAVPALAEPVQNISNDLISDTPALDAAESIPSASKSEVNQEVLNQQAARSVAKQRTTQFDSENSLNSRSKPMPLVGFSAYRKYLSDSLVYPEQAKKNKVEGEVWVYFYVEPNGNLRNFRIGKSLGAGCDQEAIRLIKEGPEWKPAHRQGMDYRAEALVKVVFNLPG